MDDAAGIVTGAFFIESECFVGYAEAIKMVIRDYGLPLYIDSDRHTIFKSPNELTLEDELKGLSIHLSNFGHALNDLGLSLIHISRNSSGQSRQSSLSFSSMQSQSISMEKAHIAW